MRLYTPGGSPVDRWSESAITKVDSTEVPKYSEPNFPEMGDCVMSARPHIGEQTNDLFLHTIHRFLSVYRYLRKYSRKIQSEGLSGREVSTLRYLLETGPCTIGQCRDYLYISDSSTSELIAHLEQAGYVSRARSQTDNRAVLVTLTPQGHKAARTLPLGGIPMLRERLKTLEPAQLARIHDALGEIQQLLEIEDDGE